MYRQTALFMCAVLTLTVNLPQGFAALHAKHIPHNNEANSAPTGNTEISKPAAVADDAQETLLIEYLRQAESAREKFIDTRPISPDDRLQSPSEFDSQITPNSFKELSLLASTEPDGLLPTNGDDPNADKVIRLFSPISDKSGELFTALFNAKHCNANLLINLLYPIGPTMGKSWIVLVEQILQLSNLSTMQRAKCIEILYSAGVTNEKYSNQIRALAIAGDELALCLFSFDNQTCLIASAVISPDRIKFARDLAINAANPEERIDCAYYCFSIDDYRLVNISCASVLRACD